MKATLSGMEGGSDLAFMDQMGKLLAEGVDLDDGMIPESMDGLSKEQLMQLIRHEQRMKQAQILQAMAQ